MNSLYAALRDALEARFYAESAFTRAVSLETFLDAVFLCKMPCCAARMTTGIALCKADAATDASPVAIASSTLRTRVRMRLRRARLTVVRRAIFRTAFFAELVLAINYSPKMSLRQDAGLEIDTAAKSRPVPPPYNGSGSLPSMADPRPRDALPVLERRRPLFDESGHSLLLIAGGEKRVK